MATSVVTGGAGFLGSHLVDELTASGESVVVLDNLTTGRLSNLAGAIASGRATFVFADIGVETKELRNIIRSTGSEKVEYIYHFVPRPHRAIHALIDIAVEQRARLIVCADDYFGHSEAIDEAAVGTAVRERGLDARIVRVLHCYGPRAHKGDDDITAMFEATLARRPLPIEGSGKQVRPMTYVADAIEGLLTVARRPPGALEPIDIVSTDEPSAIEIARTLARGVGRNFVYEYVGGHTASVDRDAPGCGDHVAFGVPPGTSLEAGLRKTYDWFTKESRLFV